MIDLLLMRKEKGLHDEIYFGSEKPSDQYLGFILVVLPLFLFRLENSV
jgi:hypothetical protein